MTPEQKERRLKELVVEAFSTAHARNLRALNNKWLRWKYVDEIRAKEKQWMESQKTGGGDMCWAIGRRIYEKEEIEVLTMSSISLFQKKYVFLKIQIFEK